MKNTGYKSFCALLFGGILLCSGTLHAQAQVNDSEITLDPVVVTAAKRDVLLSKVTSSVQIITSQELEDSGVTQLTDLGRIVPGLQIHRQGSDAFTSLSMRGVFSADFYNPSVVVYVDGIAQDQSFVDLSLSNVKRIEVLKGPQGSLYGRNAHAGVINIVTRAPDNIVRGTLKGRLAARDNEAEVRISTPLVENKLYSSLTFSGFTADGEADSLLTGESGVDDSRGRHADVKLRYAPDASPLDITLGLTYNEDVAEEVYFDENNWKSKKTNSSFTDRTNRVEQGASLNVGYDFGDIKLTSITGVLERDMDRVFVARQNEDQDSISEELRLAFEPENSALSGVAGVYAEKVSFKRDAVSFFTFNPYTADVDQESYAIFGEGTYAATDRLALTVGGRYAVDKSEFDFDETGGLAMTADDSWSTFTPKVAATYQWADNFSQFATMSRGYKPGGFNRTATNSAAEVPYDPEYSWNYETGVRGNFLDRKLQLEASVYYIDISDIQLYTGVGGQQVLRNYGNATSMGFEISGRAFLTDELELTGGVNLNRSELETSDSLDGNRTPYSPRASANAAIQHYLEVPGVPGTIISRFDVNYYGKSYLDVNNAYSQESYALFGFRLGYEWNNLRFSAFVENIFDENYKTFQSSATTIQAGEGRNAGVEVSFKF
jgi:pesticin/yersiniabactin receptor